MKGNKTAWEDEADESGLSSIRKNHAPVYGPTGGEFSSPSSEAFNRGGFRGFGEVGTQSFLPNGEYISYKDIDLPKGLTGLLGMGGKKTGEDADLSFLEFDPANPYGVGATTPYPSPLANSPDARKLWPLMPGYMTDSPDTIDFFDTGVGKSEMGQWYKSHKGVVDPWAKAIISGLFLGPAAGIGSLAKSGHNALVKGNAPGGKYDYMTPDWVDNYTRSRYSKIAPTLFGIVKGGVPGLGG